MSTASYLAGSVLAAITLGGTLAVALLVQRRMLADLAGAVRACAVGLLWTTALLAVHVIPLALGVLARPEPPLLSALGAAAAWRWLPRRAPAAPDADEARAAQPAADGPLHRALAGATTLAAAAGGIGYTAAVSQTELRQVDAVTFHLPNVAGWIQHGSLWRVDQFIPYLWQGNYPNNGDMLLLAAVLPWHSDFAVRYAMPPFELLCALAVYALARELRAPAAGAAIFACVIPALPIVASSTFAAELPDAVMYATFATGLLFGARHLRTRARSDLILAALGLGVSFGTKWYGLTSVAGVLVVWLVGELLARRRTRIALVALARRAALVVAIVALAGGIWLLRNWLESADPLFPTRVNLFGLHVFNAPPDLLRPLAGFTILHYVGQAHVWRAYLLPSFHDAFADAGWVLLGGAALAAGVLAMARPLKLDGWLVLGLLAIAALLTFAYFDTPYSAFGPPGAPLEAYDNTRYWVPALIAVAPVCAWACGRLGRAGVLLELAGSVAVVSELQRGFHTPSVGTWVLGGAVALAAAAAVAIATRGGGVSRRPGLVIVAALALALVLLALGLHQERSFMATRYADVDPALAPLARDPTPTTVGLAGIWDDDGITPVLPAFGPRLANRVSYVGPRVQHGLVQYTDEAGFVAALRRGRYDRVILGHSAFPGKPVTQPAWVIAAGYRPLVTSARFTLFARD